jgi:anti-sigma factor RsiW
LNCELAQTTVHGYFDGELDAVRSAEFERHLESCAECQAELKEIESLREQFRESKLFNQASPQLRERIRKQIQEESKGGHAKAFITRRLFIIPALSAVAAAAAAIAIVFLLFQSHDPSARVTAELIDAHVRSLQPGHLTDVLSTDQHTVKPWFDGKLDFIPPVSDFSLQGFPLVGGRLDFLDGHDVAALVYSRRKHFINLFVWPYHEAQMNLAGSGSRYGYNWLRWQSGEMQFCLISDTSPADLHQLKDLITQ